MNHLHIDRLSLHAPGLSEDGAARLARLVTRGLGSVEIPEASASRDVLRVDVQARPGEDIEALSGRIVAEIARRLSRTG